MPGGRYRVARMSEHQGGEHLGFQLLFASLEVGDLGEDYVEKPAGFTGLAEAISWLRERRGGRS